jgi:hypothetical protein|tara:strand:+ start:2525 stop:2656 length:132 start_codon:yes stop_codon:yes gene_type:complete
MGWFLFFLVLCFWLFGVKNTFKVAVITLAMFFGLLVLLGIFAT